MFCKNCGADIGDSPFCKHCNTPRDCDFPDPSCGQNPYGQNPYGQNPYGQNPYGQNPYGQNPYGQNPYNQPPYNPYINTPRPDDAPNAGWSVLGFFFPLIGLILYLVWKADYPRRAHCAGKGALISVICYAAFVILYIVFMFVFLVGILPYIYVGVLPWLL